MRNSIESKAYSHFLQKENLPDQTLGMLAMCYTKFVQSDDFTKFLNAFSTRRGPVRETKLQTETELKTLYALYLPLGEINLTTDRKISSLDAEFTFLNQVLKLTDGKNRVVIKRHFIDFIRKMVKEGSQSSSRTTLIEQVSSDVKIMVERDPTKLFGVRFFCVLSQELAQQIIPKAETFEFFAK